jgi:hypothetical protein
MTTQHFKWEDLKDIEIIGPETPVAADVTEAPTELPPASPEAIMAIYGLTARLPEPSAEPEPDREPVPLQFFKGLAGGVEDVTKRLFYQTVPDQWIGRAGLAPWEFERNVPQSSWESIGRLLGTGLGILPGEKPFSAMELQQQPFWEQALMATAFPGLTAPNVQKSIGTVLRGGLTGRTAPRIPAPKSVAVDKINDAVNNAVKLLPEQKELYRIDRGEKARAAAQAVERATLEAGGAAPTLDDIQRSLGNLEGELPKVQFDRLRSKLTVDDIHELEEMIFTASKPGKGTTAINIGDRSVDYYDYLNNMKALGKVLDSDNLPTRGELTRLEKIFGSDLVDNIRARQSDKRKIWNTTMDVLGARKALIASIDMSAPGRQGWKLAFSPYWKQYLKAWGIQFKMLDPIVGKERFDIMMAGLKDSPYYELAKKSGVFEGELAASGRSISSTEEVFMGRWVSKIPGVDISERAYVGFLNKLRLEAFYKTADDWAKSGLGPKNRKATNADYEDLAQLINWSTGRGSVPQNLTEVLNAGFFSPRFAASSPQFYWRGLKATRDIGNRDAQVSKIWAQIAVGHVAKNMGILGLLYGAEKAGILPDFEVEINPLATDFGKVRVGQIRYDFWAGDAQWAKFIARGFLGKRLSSTTGELMEQDRDEVLWKFVRSKFSPGAADINDFILTQEDFYGNAITGDAETMREQAKNRLLFMFAQDVLDVMALERTDMTSWSWALPSFIGVGVQAYETALDIKNEIALREHGMLYEDLIDVEDGYQLQSLIDVSADVQNFYNERRKKRKEENPDTMWFQGMNLYRERIDEIEQGSPRETGLRQVIESGAEGKALDSAINRYLGQRSNLWTDVIPYEVEAIKEGRITDIYAFYRDRYWSVQLPRDLKTGIPDYEKQEDMRQEILEEAVAKGLIESNITERGPISSDSVINEVVTRWQDDQRYLRENYYDKGDDLIKAAGYWNYYQKYKASSWAPLYRQMDPEFDKLIKDVGKYRAGLRSINPEIERILFRWGDISTLTNPTVIEEVDMSAGVDEVLEALRIKNKTVEQGQ